MPAAQPGPDESARLRVLHALGILDTPEEERFDRITRLAARVFDVPMVAVSLVDANRQWFKSCIGLDRETGRDVSFCAYAILGDEALVIEDASSDPRFADMSVVTSDPPHIRFYAGQPLCGAEGYKLGTLCVIDSRPRTFDATDRENLRDLAAWAESELEAKELRSASGELTEESERMQALIEERAELERMKEEFVANISHDLRTPLTAVRGYVDMIRDEESGPLTDEQRSDLEVVHRNVNWLEALINDLLLVSHLEADKFTLDRKRFDLAASVRALVDPNAAIARERGVAQLVEAPQSLEVVGDERAIERAVSNLVSNAIKFSPDGGTVRLLVEPNGDSARVKVADQGPGIPVDEISRLGERFYRGSNVSVPGTGLGLAITREITELHGGSLEIESEVGGGSTFTVVIPRHPAG